MRFISLDAPLIKSNKRVSPWETSPLSWIPLNEFLDRAKKPRVS